LRAIAELGFGARADVAAHAGTAFDGKHLFQLAEDRIQKIDPKTGRVICDCGRELHIKDTIAKVANSLAIRMLTNRIQRPRVS
jgi:hypothetical protein